MTCPHYQNNSCLILAGHGLLRIAPSGNPNHPCDHCRSQWTDGQPPTAELLTPTLLAIIEIANPREQFQDDEGAEPSTKFAQRSQCDHLGKIVNRKGCNCPRRWTRECDLLKIHVSQNNECQQCEHWTPVG